MNNNKNNNNKFIIICIILFFILILSIYYIINYTNIIKKNNNSLKTYSISEINKGYKASNDMDLCKKGCIRGRCIKDNLNSIKDEINDKMNDKITDEMNDKITDEITDKITDKIISIDDELSPNLNKLKNDKEIKKNMNNNDFCQFNFECNYCKDRKYNNFYVDLSNYEEVLPDYYNQKKISKNQYINLNQKIKQNNKQINELNEKIQEYNMS